MFSRRADPVGDLMLNYQQRYYSARRRANDLYIAVQRFLDDDLDLESLRTIAEACRGNGDDLVVYIPKRYRDEQNSTVPSFSGENKPFRSIRRLEVDSR